MLGLEISMMPLLTSYLKSDLRFVLLFGSETDFQHGPPSGAAGLVGIERRALTLPSAYFNGLGRNNEGD